ncbi:MAG: hypothetical protein ABIR37_02515 [Candidatus Saccharimonadales bacterium]
MGRRHQRMIGKQQTAFDPEALLRAIQRPAEDQNDKLAVPQPGDSTQTLPTPSPSLIVGRQMGSNSFVRELKEYFSGHEGVTYRPYVPTVLYATRQLLERSFQTPHYGPHARAYLSEVVQSVQRQGGHPTVSLCLPLGSLETEFHKGAGFVSLAFRFGKNAENDYLLRERRLIVRAYSPEGDPARVRRPVVLEVGRLSLSGPMRRRFDPAELHLNIPMPEYVELEPVNVMNLREPTKLL